MTAQHLMLILNATEDGFADITCGTAIVGVVDRTNNSITCRINGATTKFNGGWASWLADEIKKSAEQIY